MEFDFKNWLLAEMPISSFNLTGKWGPEDKRYHYDRQSIGILTNPKGVEKIHRKWSNTKQNFDLYMIRGPRVWKQNFEGEVSQQWVKEKLGLDIVPNEENITIILTNNISGPTGVPLTAWGIAHRFAHGLYRETMFREYFRQRVIKDFSNLLRTLFPQDKPSSWNSPEFDRNYDGSVLLKHIAQGVGAMKSAREGKVDNFNEFINELVAQYITTGKIKFNPLPRSFLIRKRMAWGNDASTYRSHRLSDDHIEEVNELLESYASNYEYLLNEVFNNLEGRMFCI